MIVINSLKNITTSESYYGKSLLIGNSMIIPFFNISVMDTFTNETLDLAGFYIDKGYLVFEDIQNLTFDYEVSRRYVNKGQGCYGGVNVLNNQYYEFWVASKKTKFILGDEFIKSKTPFEFKEDDQSLLSFLNFEGNSDLVNILNG